MAFPTTAILDRFDRADGEAGPNWTAAYSGTSPLEPEIESEKLKNGAAGLDCGAYWTPSEFRNCEVYGTLAVLPDPTDSPFELKLRTKNLGRNGPPPANDDYSGYVLQIFLGGEGVMRAWNGTSATDFNFLDFGLPGAGDAFGFSIVGNVLTAYRKPVAGAWTLIGPPATNSVYSDAGYIGVMFTEVTARLDNFGGGETGAQSGPSQFQTQLAGRGAC